VVQFKYNPMICGQAKTSLREAQLFVGQAGPSYLRIRQFT